MTQPKTELSAWTDPLDETWTALDLETTGLSPRGDEIIEVGAVRFRGDEVLDTFESFVNPGRKLSRFIIDLTGIRQRDVDAAPTFGEIAGELLAFLGSTPLVGHNVDFDLGFLRAKGLGLSNPVCDTWELAYIIRPDLKSYALGSLTAQLHAAHETPHRAVDDANATRQVFMTLLREMGDLDEPTRAEIGRLAQRSGMKLRSALTPARPPSPASQRPRIEGGPRVPERDKAKRRARPGISGLDLEELASRLAHRRPLRPNEQASPVDTALVESMLRAGSEFSRAISGFEERAEQVEMARAVAETLNDGGRLIVEAGTGVGKSLAYLLPAAIYAVLNNKRVVVSTNTINLQEQLVQKDLPMLVAALAAEPELSGLDLSYTQLKGRSNYLCVRKWQHLRASEGLDEAEARMVAKTLLWLRTTETGDRSEINLGGGAAAAPWDRLSAQGDCSATGGACFLRAARDRAAASHIVVVNHALLLSDLAMGGTVIPEYDILIVDEAHHLEDEATRQLGFDLPQSAFDDHFQALGGDRGLFNESVAAVARSEAEALSRESIRQAVGTATAGIPPLREALARVFNALAATLFPDPTGRSDRNGDARVTASTRTQPAWSDIEVLWENADLMLSELGSSLSGLHRTLDGFGVADLPGYDGMMLELGAEVAKNGLLRGRLREFVVEPREDGIYWSTRSAQSNDIELHLAPLHVGEILDQTLYSAKGSVILTSATLSTNGDFNHVTDRVGFDDARQLLLGSPFDYASAALVCTPRDMAQPSDSDYQTAVNDAVQAAALATGGRTMALFTSHAALRACASAVRGRLRGRGIEVLAQGVDGTPQRLLSRFLERPETLLLGTSSFWEGVDLAGDALKVLVVARLPFNVPTDPVFAARSELYENPFNEYAVPEAILRLRQGFGRLIRTKTDRGVAVILDRRILSRAYGRAFMRSLPPVTTSTPLLEELPAEIARWLGL